MKKILSALFACAMLVLALTTATKVSAAGLFQFVTQPPLPGAIVGNSYSATITFSYSGSYAPNATISGLPNGIIGNGLASNPNSVIGIIPSVPGGTASVVLSGTPTQDGQYTVSISLDDQHGVNATQTYALIVAKQGTFNVTTTSLPAATAGQQYSASINFIYNGTYAPNAYFTGLPSGITAGGLASNPNNVLGIIPSSNGTVNLQLSGTPTQAGQYTVTMTLDGTTVQTTKTFALLVAQTGSFNFTTNSLPNAIVGTPYSATVSMTYNGTYAPNATWTGLPTGIIGQGFASNPNNVIGIIPSSSGVINLTLSGTPTQAGTYTVNLAMDGTNTTTNKTFTLTVGSQTTSNPSITILSPSGGQQFAPGSSVTLNYSVAGNMVTPNAVYFVYLKNSPNQILGSNNSPSPTYVPLVFRGAGFPSTVTIPSSWSGSSYLELDYADNSGNPVATVTSNAFTVTATAANTTTNNTTTNTNTGNNINLPDGTVIKLPNSPTVYLVTGGQLQPFTSAQDFLNQGYTWSQVQQVSPSQVSTPPATSGSNSGLSASSFYPYPSGSLVNDGGTVYFVSGKSKIPFTSYQAFVGLGYSFQNVIQGDLTNYTLENNYAITSANAAHPWGSWLIYNGTVYYSSQNGMIGVPSSQIFTSNGGNWSLLVKANSYDVAALNANPNLSVMTLNDVRVTQ